MFEQTRKNFKIKELVQKVHQYNESKYSDLPSIGDDILSLITLLNTQITKIEKRIKRNITLKTCLEHNKLILSYFALNNKVLTSDWQYKYNGKLNKDLENLVFYTDLRKEVNNKYNEAIKRSKELNILKYKLHSLIALYDNANYKQITKTSNSKYDNLTFEQQLEMLQPKLFYSLKEDDVKQLLQAISNSYTKHMGIKQIPIIFLSGIENIYSLGSYASFGNYINANNNLIKMFNKFKAENNPNPALPYKILLVIIHESRHAYQYTNKSTSAMDRYVRNATMINNHYFTRIFYPENIYSEEFKPGYFSKLCELDAYNESYKYVLELSKLNISNALEIRDFTLFSLPKNYKAENSTVKEMIALANNHGLPPKLTKILYQNMKLLNLVTNDDVVLNEDKIDYRKTINTALSHINNETISHAEEKEESLRKEYFATLFNRDNIIENYASESGLNKDTFENGLISTYKPFADEISDCLKNDSCM